MFCMGVVYLGGFVGIGRGYLEGGSWEWWWVGVCWDWLGVVRLGGFLCGDVFSVVIRG